MAKVLIAYATKYQGTKWCAERIKEKIGMPIDCVNVLENPDVAKYDIVVFGSSVRSGKLLPEAKTFLSENATLIAERTHALFLVCGKTEEAEYYMEHLFPSAVTRSAFAFSYFGGSLSTEGKSFWEKLKLRRIRSQILENEIDDGEYTPTLPAFLPETIDVFAGLLKNEILKANKG